MVERFVISPTLTFILTDSKILVKTSHQTSLVVYNNGNYRRQWMRLRDKIREKEIMTIVDLLEYNNCRIGGTSQIQGLMLVNTEESRHV